MTWLFPKIFAQTGEQARHAFAACPEVNTVGVIFAIGDLWTYRDVFGRYAAVNAITLGHKRELWLLVVKPGQWRGN